MALARKIVATLAMLALLGSTWAIAMVPISAAQTVAQTSSVNSSGADDQHMPACPDCGTDAMRAPVCLFGCVVPPSAIASSDYVPFPIPAPAVLPTLHVLNGRAIAPDPHPPKARL
jgi:hypothetical protein